MLLEGPGCVCDEGSRNTISLEWLFQRPSVLLWADEILVSMADYEYVLTGHHAHGGLFEESAALLFDALHDEGIIRVIDPNDYLPNISRDSVTQQVLFDIGAFGSEPSVSDESGLVEPAMIKGEYGSFCGYMLESMYTNLLMSNLLHCSCLVDDNKALYLKHRFDHTKERGLVHGNAFDELYSIAIPELQPFHDFQLFCPDEISSSCANAANCAADVKRNVRKYRDAILFYRSDKEIRGLSSLVEEYENERKLNDEAVSEAVLKDVIKAQKRLRDSLPQAKRWCKIVTGVAGAIGIANRVASDDSASVVAAATVGIGCAGFAFLDWTISRDSWKITFAEKYINGSRTSYPA